jgi:hypothetical protein
MAAEGCPQSKTASEGNIIVKVKSSRSYVGVYGGISRPQLVKQYHKLPTSSLGEL